MTAADRTRTPSGGRIDRVPGWFGWLLPAGFSLVALGLVAGSEGPDIPLTPAHQVDRADLKVAPRRTAMTDPAQIKVEGALQNCNGCHQIFKSDSPSGASLHFHQDLRLSHGLNNRCVNCHDPKDREQLTLRDGETVPFAETPQLCAQCHGTVYRDWQRGTHGKTLGSWITHSEAQRRLNCNECHNPHSPKYEPITALPGPSTLRMGDQSHSSNHDKPTQESPLQRWLNKTRETGTPHISGHGGKP